MQYLCLDMVCTLYSVCCMLFSYAEALLRSMYSCILYFILCIKYSIGFVLCFAFCFLYSVFCFLTPCSSFEGGKGVFYTRWLKVGEIKKIRFEMNNASRFGLAKSVVK